ncbi:MAG: OmpH family outer membrane protein [Spirochaetota bacterium]|nr:MAG: OmpH family outer membrane protein [Spirochaetota bacterium]
MKKRIILLIVLSFLMIPSICFPITLVRAGYIDLDLIIQTYTTKYLETEIVARNEYIRYLEELLTRDYFELTEIERIDIRSVIKDQHDVLDMLHYNFFLWENSGELKDDIVYQILQRDIMDAIQKTSELEGFNLILDNTGNFVYGSEDINLTDKVLFRLDERLLDIQNSEPKAPLSRELEEELVPLTVTENE